MCQCQGTACSSTFATVSTGEVNRNVELFLLFVFGEVGGVLSGLRAGGTIDRGTPVRHGFSVAGVVNETGSFEKQEVTPNAANQCDLVVSALHRGERGSENNNQRTYNTRIETSSVHSSYNSMIEIIQVTLVLILQLMEEIEQIKVECR